MKQSRGWIVIAAALGTLAAAPAKSLRDYPVQPVPFTAVHLADTFWLSRIEIKRTVTIPLDPTRRTLAERRYRCCYRWQADYHRIRGSHAPGTFSLCACPGADLRRLLPVGRCYRKHKENEEDGGDEDEA